MIQKLKNMKNSLIVMVMALGVLFAGPLAYSPAVQAQGKDSCQTSSILALPPWYKGLCDGEGGIKSPGDDVGAFVWTIALNIIEMLLYIIGYVSLGFVIWGGFKYIISGDDASGVAGAKKTILNALIGLVLSIASVGIVNVISGAVTV